MAKESVIEKMKHKMQPPPPKEVSISEATESMRKVLEKQVSEETMRKERYEHSVRVASGWHKFTMSMKIWQSLPAWCTTSART